MPDHSVMFSNMTKQILEQVTSYVVALKSKDCVNIKTTMAKIVGQVMGSTDMVS